MSQGPEVLRCVSSVGLKQQCSNFKCRVFRGLRAAAGLMALEELRQRAAHPSPPHALQRVDGRVHDGRHVAQDCRALCLCERVVCLWGAAQRAGGWEGRGGCGNKCTDATAIATACGMALPLQEAWEWCSSRPSECAATAMESDCGPKKKGLGHCMLAPCAPPPNQRCARRTPLAQCPPPKAPASARP